MLPWLLPFPLAPFESLSSSPSDTTDWFVFELSAISPDADMADPAADVSLDKAGLSTSLESSLLPKN